MGEQLKPRFGYATSCQLRPGNSQSAREFGGSRAEDLYISPELPKPSLGWHLAVPLAQQRGSEEGDSPLSYLTFWVGIAIGTRMGLKTGRMIGVLDMCDAIRISGHVGVFLERK